MKLPRTGERNKLPASGSRCRGVGGSVPAARAIGPDGLCLTHRRTAAGPYVVNRRGRTPIDAPGEGGLFFYRPSSQGPHGKRTHILAKKRKGDLNGRIREWPTA